MYYYKRTEPQLWTVFYSDGNECFSESDHGSAKEAANRVSFLNGGVSDGEVNHAGNTFPGYGEEGMTFRMFAAAQAMNGLLANSYMRRSDIAKQSVQQADALIKALNL